MAVSEHQWTMNRFCDFSVSPEGQKLLDELAMVFVEAAVRRLIKEEALRRATQPPEIT